MASLTADKESKRFELIKIVDNGETNNYAEFEIKSRFELDANDLWKYIDGPKAVSPVIPKLTKARSTRGKDENGVERTIYFPGNEVEV